MESSLKFISSKGQRARNLHLEDQDIQNIINEDDRHHEDLKVDMTYEQLNAEPNNFDLINVPKIRILRKSEGSRKSFRRKMESVDSRMEQIPDDYNICEIFHNDDHVKIILKFTSVKEEVKRLGIDRLRQSHTTLRSGIDYPSEPEEISGHSKSNDFPDRSTAAANFINQHKKRETLEKTHTRK